MVSALFQPQKSVSNWIAEIVYPKYADSNQIIEKILSKSKSYTKNFIGRAEKYYLSTYFEKERFNLARLAVAVTIRLIKIISETKRGTSQEEIRKLLLDKGRVLFNILTDPTWGYYPKDYISGDKYYPVKDQHIPKITGANTFNPMLFEMMLGLGTAKEIMEALSLIDSTQYEISQGLRLSSYDELFTANLKLSDAFCDYGLEVMGKLQICYSAMFYNQYSSAGKDFLDSFIKTAEPSWSMLAEVYIYLGPTYSQEDLNKALEFLRDKVASVPIAGGENGISENITKCYLDLAQHFGRRGYYRQAFDIASKIQSGILMSSIDDELRKLVIKDTEKWKQKLGTQGKESA